jgi:hypothetical protein
MEAAQRAGESLRLRTALAAWRGAAHRRAALRRAALAVADAAVNAVLRQLLLTWSAWAGRRRDLAARGALLGSVSALRFAGAAWVAWRHAVALGREAAQQLRAQLARRAARRLGWALRRWVAAVARGRALRSAAARLAQWRGDRLLPRAFAAWRVRLEPPLLPLTRQLQGKEASTCMPMLT